LIDAQIVAISRRSDLLVETVSSTSCPSSIRPQPAATRNYTNQASSNICEAALFSTTSMLVPNRSSLLLILVNNLIIAAPLLSPTGFKEISVAASSPSLSVLIRHTASTGGSCELHGDNLHNDWKAAEQSLELWKRRQERKVARNTRRSQDIWYPETNIPRGMQTGADAELFPHEYLNERSLSVPADPSRKCRTSGATFHTFRPIYTGE